MKSIYVVVVGARIYSVWTNLDDAKRQAMKLFKERGLVAGVEWYEADPIKFKKEEVYGYA